MTDKVTDANIWKSICRQHIQKKCSPSLPTSLFAFSTSSKFDHVFASCTLSTIRRLTNLSTHTEKEFNMHKNYRGWTSTSDTVQIVTCLTDTTALSFHGAFFIILLYLIREECIKDLVDQLCSGCFSWSLTIFFYLCWVTNSLSSGSPPVNRTKCMVRRRRFYSAQITDDK